MLPIELYDTTLRDGTQGESVNFSAHEKLRIAHQLDQFGIHYIEGGWPGSNPRDMEFFELARDVEFKQARLTAFGATRRPGIGPEDDANLSALISSGTRWITIFGKSWDLHVETVMNNTLEENLAMIRDSIAYLVSHQRNVIYDAEHFFDGYRKNPQYALATLKAATDSGALTLVLCDTNGGRLPSEIEDATAHVRKYLADNHDNKKGNGPPAIGIHTHNDSGLAAANTIIAVQQGASMVQGTINGYGERCGNADLTTLIPILRLKMNRECVPVEALKKLNALSNFVSEMANIVPLKSRPFVGQSAFAHKGGIHVSAIARTPKSYEHIDPEVVGNQRRVLVSDLSGKSNIIYKDKELGLDLKSKGLDSAIIVKHIKQLELEGYQFDVADGSFRLLIEKLAKQFNPLFSLESFRVTIEKDKDRPCSAFATIKIRVDDKVEITAAEGSGPVGALDNALRKALANFFPDLDLMHLVDYKVRVIDGAKGTSSKVRVLIESRDQDDIWNTVGVSEDIIEASWQALADSFHYKLAWNKDKMPD